MRILVLEPFFGGSHRSFLDRWITGSRHTWTLLTLPPYKWKWRMRHAAITFAGQIRERLQAGEGWDLVFCSDMLDLAQLRGLVPSAVHQLPAVAYFHENQLTYPVRDEQERDLHYGFTNLTTAMAANEVWFNSAFHRDELLAAWRLLLKRMPDHQPLAEVDAIASRARVMPQGIDVMPVRGERAPGPLRILWVARWEFDKDPEAFFAALELARERGAELRLSVLGESFRQVPEVFADARQSFASEIDHWGYQESREAYLDVLMRADVVVSTAQHEFFGVAVTEAIAAGCYPVLPRRLAYPEILAELDHSDEHFYDGSAEQLARRVVELAAQPDDLWGGETRRAVEALARFSWPALRPRLDDALEEIGEGR